MEYLILFDDNGRRLETYPVSFISDEKKQELINDGFVIVSKSDWEYYAGVHGRGKNGTGYIRDSKTGKPVDAPIYIPTKKELAESLYNGCQADLQQIDNHLMNAVAIGNDELVADLRTERAERIKQYQADLKKLEGE